MSQKSFWDKFLGERLCERIGTLGGAGRLVIGVTTLGSNGVLVVSLALIFVCIHVVREVPKFVVFLVSRVQLFFILAVRNMSCFNPRGHGKEPQQTTVGAVSGFARDSK
jgi:hypothetical protein